MGLASKLSTSKFSNNDPTSFEALADRYDRNDHITGGWLTQWLEGVLAGRQGESAIDLGCGTGRVAQLLAKHYAHVRAIDLSEEMINVARSRRPDPRIEYEQADLTTITGSYDLVVSLMTLHHVADLPSALDHISGLANPGGLVVVVDSASAKALTPSGLRIWAFKNFVYDTYNAFQKFRYNMDRQWIDHRVSDRYLDPVTFEGVYGQAFPGAAVGPIEDRYTAVWEKK